MCEFGIYLWNFSVSILEDPYVEGIGKICKNNTNDCITTSGYTDFSIWNIKNGILNHIGHSLNSNDKIKNNGTLTCESIFIQKDQILNVTSQGELGIFTFLI